MTYWAWVPGLETGLKEIDRQHKKLVDYINLMAEAVKELDVAKTEAVLDALINYTVVHFNFEEKMMDKAGYEFSSEHKLVHEAFKVRVLGLRKRIEEGESVNASLMNMLVKWIVDHIKKEDMRYIDSVKPVLANRSWLSKTTDKLFTKKL